jgi:hypothetical protein
VKGEFIRGDGLVLPNNVTAAGARQLLLAAFRADVGVQWVMGVAAAAVFQPVMNTGDWEESANSGRQLIPRDATGWPVQGEVNGEPYVESRAVEFPANTYEVTRLFLADQGFGQPTKLLALSSPLPTPLQVTALTPAAQRTFKYRLYLR